MQQDIATIKGDLAVLAQQAKQVSEAAEATIQQAVTVDTQRCIIRVDGKDHPAKPHQCQIILALIEAKGQIVSGTEIANTRPGCHGKKIPRELKKLRGEIPALNEYIKSAHARGFYLVSK
jgi:DNA-binding response OmpR family regulator